MNYGYYVITSFKHFSILLEIRLHSVINTHPFPGIFTIQVHFGYILNNDKSRDSTMPQEVRQPVV